MAFGCPSTRCRQVGLGLPPRSGTHCDKGQKGSFGAVSTTVLWGGASAMNSNEGDEPRLFLAAAAGIAVHQVQSYVVEPNNAPLRTLALLGLVRPLPHSGAYPIRGRGCGVGATRSPRSVRSRHSGPRLGTSSRSCARGGSNRRAIRRSSTWGAERSCSRSVLPCSDITTQEMLRSGSGCSCRPTYETRAPGANLRRRGPHLRRVSFCHARRGSRSRSVWESNRASSRL